MIYLNQTYELLAGGFHAGNRSWNKRHTEIDNCFKLYQLTEGNVHVCSDQDDFTLEKGKMYFIVNFIKNFIQINLKPNILNICK